MPLFRKQSQTAKRRLQHQQYLAKEAPEKTYDLSNCELSEIPSGIFSLCKVFQKEALLIHTNWLSSLKGGGELRDLCTIRVLDLHDNELGCLPDDLSPLRSLQVLNVENNKLRHLPDSLGTITTLQTLNVRGNKLRDLPSTVKNICSLRTVDVSKNQVTRLPRELCRAHTVENLIVDADRMEYPPADVCQQGTQAMMQRLCRDCGVDYEPPSKYLLDVLDAPTVVMATTPIRTTPLTDMDFVNKQVEKYALAKVTRQQEMATLERQMEADNRLQAKVAAESARNKKHLLDYVAHDQERMLEELSCLQQLREQDRRKLVSSLQEAEQNASDLILRLLELSEKARHTEELLDQMERERMETEEWFKVREEEMANLRKHEVLTAMQHALASNLAMDDMIHKYLLNKEERNQRTHDMTDVAAGHVENALNERSVHQENLVSHLIREEKLQKEAFVVLQMQKDLRHARLTGQINLISRELAQLTAVEINRRETREETTKDILEQRRAALTEMLIQLNKEKNARELELRKRMLEMEEQRENDQTDYWLVQYQRLMDRKPQAMIDKEKQLEFVVIEILEAAHATEYIPLFARHRITIETLCHLTADDLKQMGVHQLGLRKAILLQVECYKCRREEERAAAKKKQIDNDWIVKPPPAGESPFHPTPSAPKTPTATSPPISPPRTPTSPPLEVTARGLNTECVICMDGTSCMLFLNCGHVCTCRACSEPVKECPLCRSDILQRILLPLS